MNLHIANIIIDFYTWLKPVFSFVFGHGEFKDSEKYQFIYFAFSTGVWAGIIITADFAMHKVAKTDSLFDLGYSNLYVFIPIIFWIIGSGLVSLVLCKFGLLKTTNISAITVSVTWMGLFSKEIKNLLKGKSPRQNTRGGTRI